MTSPGPGRVEALDLIRGVAVLGILAINIAGFAGPPTAILSPHLPQQGTRADEAAFAFTFVFFEGKMRALFAILFGASLVLFHERSRSWSGDLLQWRRLGWLALFGLVHYYLFWWGDILFLLALAGMLALPLRDAAIKPLLAGALAIFVLWHMAGMAMSWPLIAAEERVRLGTAEAAEFADHAAYLQAVDDAGREHIAQVGGGFFARAAASISTDTLQPLATAVATMGETLPLMLLGVVLCRTGFFSGGWPLRRLRQVAWLGTGGGLVLTLAFLVWAWPRDFPTRGMEAIFLYWAALPHLLLALGYAAILVLAAPRLAGSNLGQRLVAAGRTAFSNYIGTTLFMTAIFYGWGLGLIGTVGHAPQWAFVLGGWLLMLAWSKPWLERYRRGPLEWLWRSLTERRMLTNLR